MRGQVADWKEARGFGFIEPEVGGKRVFFHISGMARGASRPAVGDIVSYEVVTTSDGRVRAVNVGPAGLTAVSGALTSRRVILSLVALLILPALWWCVTVGVFPAWLFWAFAGMSSLAFVLYGQDKWAARRQAQRTAESTLQFCALLGGWPGALLAQQVFRHKTTKRSFQITFWFMVAINAGALGLLGSPTGAALLQNVIELP
ncbi:DUF1294 domain-containing protein [Halomonas nitroreducens]|uniref:DUF1294 domain-containing protein n=1 Tax=Halomonas nitroreducens TaxID=447425 RepID=A0A431V2W3_9GAMM|nr:cold shock and DUF1294 domain-containing protein [Halomonas nitroreducens]RTR02460.1 DUF1294 domain-containing protein [Halomonas nitroreducens]